MRHLALLLGLTILVACAGPEGERGPQGDIGPTGAPGQDGQDGQDGPQGEEGAQGPQGVQGLVSAEDLYWSNNTSYITSTNDAAIALCDAGDLALSGGCNTYYIVYNGPHFEGGGVAVGWKCTASAGPELTAYVQCVEGGLWE